MVLKGFIPHKEYVEISERRLELFRQKKIRSMVTDIRGMKVLSAESQKFNNEVFIPALYQVGIKRSYMVAPDDTFAKFMLDRSNQKVVQRDGKLKVELFAKLEDALDFLREELLVKHA